MEDRYSVLITLSDQAGADGFHKNLNGRKYAPSEVLEHGKEILLGCLFSSLHGTKLFFLWV